MKPYNVFLSYAGADRSFADRLSLAIAGSGAIIVDPLKTAQTGDDFSDVVESSLKSADFVVFVVPEHEGEGKASWFELGAARVLGKPIVPVAPDRKRRINNASARQLSGMQVMDGGSRPLREIAAAVIAAADKLVQQH